MSEKPKKDYWFVGKVQVSISGNPGTLIYDENKRWQHICEREFGESILGEDLKGYFKMCHRKNGELYVHRRVKDRDW